MIHLPSFSLQGMSHSSIAIAWKVQNELFYGITQGHCFFQRGFHIWVVLPLVVPGTIDLQLLRETTDGNGQPLLTGVLDHRMPLVKGSLPNAFFSRVFSRASCPQNRSSSAILASAEGPSELDGGRKASSPRCSYSFLQRETTLEARLCSRQICAGRFSPLAHCRAIASLNSLV